MRRPTIDPRRRSRAVLAVLVLAAGWVITTSATAPVTASAACAATTNRSISGIVMGQDHRDINAQISFDVVDRAGHHIGPNGCIIDGYYKSLFINPTLSGQGALRSVTQPNTWRLSGLPSNATGVWIELWTRTNTGPKACPTCAGQLDTSRYGFVNRRNVPIGSTVRLIAPLNCGVNGGTSGNIQGYVRYTNGRPVRASIYAWSELTPDGSLPLQGWGQGVQLVNGYYKIDNLASGQNYALWVTVNGKTYKRLHLPVRSCKAVPVSIGVS